ncbi:MAG TPA: UPF0179 family protein [Thermoplasmatales archaeon]|nr:UPF0179 family protein [Thermoplasmatales archaeon]
MTLVTLIGEKLAEKNLEFIYLGPLSECRNCKLKNVCFNLKPHRRYRITNVRDKRHSCNIHMGNVVAVEVEELPIEVTVEKRHTLGSIIKIEKRNCDNIECKYYELCNNEAIQKDKTYKIVKIHDTIDCPKGLKLNRAEVIE